MSLECSTTRFGRLLKHSCNGGACGVMLAAMVLFRLGMAAAAELGAAPLYFESQATSGWVRQIVPKAAKTRADVAALYHSTFLPGDAVALVWTGSVAMCAPATTNAEHQQAAIARVNYYRTRVDLAAVSLLAGNETAQEQAAALMISANPALSHTPPASWLCYTAGGATGAGSSNIALGANGVVAIDLYMHDSSDGPDRVVMRAPA